MLVVRSSWKGQRPVKREPEVRRSGVRAWTTSTMSAAATTSRTDESLIRATGLRLLGVHVVLSARANRGETARAQGRVCRLQRSRRLHAARGANRPGGCGGVPRALSRTPALRARAPRRNRREVHRRRGHGALRRTGRARGRSRACGQSCARYPRVGPRERRGAGANRRHHRRGADPARRPPRGRGRDGVGRARELTVLRDAFERARHERTPHLVTLVGVPGMGKSRLVYELSRMADADPEIITWRQGRCLAYGDGVTLWALGEIVKAQAGIVEQDTPEDVVAKVQRAVENAVADSSDVQWVASHVLALVGLAEETELGGDRRGEAFAAWRRLLEGLAEQRPLVLVFEDLHWADESLLDFVDELVDWVSDVPLLVVGTARPELLERRGGWGGGKASALTISLPPLSESDTTRLVEALLEASAAA